MDRAEVLVQSEHVEPPSDAMGSRGDYPQVTLEDLRAPVSRRRALDRAVLVPQLKLGLRATELCNVRVEEVNPDHSGLRDFYPDIGKRLVRSHYGGHHFTTYWDVHRDWNSELVAYMRGDAAGNRNAGGPDSMSHYLHAHYEDIEAPYREQVFKLGV